MSRPTNYAQNDGVFMVSAKRFARSPWLDSYLTDSTVLGVYSGRFYALSSGADPETAYWCLRREAVLFDVPEHPIEITGPDALAFFERLFCREVSRLKVGRAAYMLACNHDGGILMDGLLLRLEEDRYWYVLADGEFLTWLEAHRIGFDVSVRDPDSWVLQVQGPRSFEVLAAVLDERPPDPFPYFSLFEGRMAGEPFLVSRTGWTGELGFELYSLNPAVDGADTYRHLMTSGARAGLSQASLDSMGIRRIEAGILDNGTDMDSSMTPFEAGLGRFVDLDKTGYIGREAHRRAARGCLLYGISSPPDTPVGRHTVLHEGREAGRLTTSARSPFLRRVVGYARFRTPGDWAGTTIQLRAEDGSSYPGVVSGLPFYDTEKRIPRGLPESPSTSEP